MQIRIYLDGTFESLSATDPKAALAALKADLKIITKVERLRAARTDAKRMANAAKDKELLAQIKALKATLSSNRNSSIEIVKDKIAKLGAAPAAKPDLKAKLAARQTKAVRAPKKPSNSEERAPRTKEERATRDANKKPLKPRSKSKDEKALDRVHEAENALIKYRENKPHPVHDKIRPGDKVAKAEMREMEQLMADLPEAKTNYRKMPKSAVMQKSRDNAKKMIDAMEKRLDMLKKKYIGQAKK